MTNEKNEYYSDENSNERLAFITEDIKIVARQLDIALDKELWEAIEKLENWREEYFQEIMDV